MRSRALLLLLFAGAARAHHIEYPKRDLLLLEAERATVRVVYEMDPGDPSAGARALFDRDSDGRLSPAEQDLLLSFLARVAQEGLSLWVDGSAVALERTAVRGVGLDAPVADSAGVGLELTLAGALPPLAPSRSVRFQDRTRDGKKHVLLEVRAGEGLTLGRPSQGDLAPDKKSLANVMLSAEVPLEVRLRAPEGGAWDRFLRRIGLR